MKSNLVVLFLAITAVLLLVGGPAAVESATTCSVTELTPCAPAILGSVAPSTQCCSALAAQTSCFCEYKEDPTLSTYFAGGQKVAAACGVTIPSCN